MATDDDSDVDSSSIFEIDDYTVVTPMEQFTTAVESVLAEWEITGNRSMHKFAKVDLPHLIFESRSKQVQLPGANRFLFTHYYLKEREEYPVISAESKRRGITETQFLVDMTSSVFDLSHILDITTMFGVSEFLLLTPFDPSDTVSLEDDLQWLRSAFNCAAQTSPCHIPMFVQFGEQQKRHYFGIGCGPETYTEFESGFLRRGQRQHTHLSGLLSVFKSKVASPTIRDQGEIRTSILFEYRCVEERLPEYGVFNEDTASAPFRLEKYAFGTGSSPIAKISVLALWPNQSEDLVNESSTYSDLDHLSAFEWQLFMDFCPDQGELSEGFSQLLNAVVREEAPRKVKEYLGIREPGIDSLFNKKNFDPNPGKRVKLVSPLMEPLEPDFMLKPLDDEVAQRWVNAIFHFSKDAEKLPTGLPPDVSAALEALYSQSNGCSFNCVCARLARAFYHLSLNPLHPKDANLQLWHSFVEELRRRYDRGEDVTDDESLKEPNLLKCLLHQKLEMLQCCLVARRQRHALYNNVETFGDDDEFFDAVEETTKETSPGSSASSSDGSNRSISDGRLKQHEELKLLYHPDQALYTFVTQNAAPMTEDMVVAQQEYLENLSDEERLKTQLSSLISDMQAFKAANPLGHFHDFIRWHSPKDWDEEKACLSERFANSDNVWKKCWEEARPMAVVNQQRLFNETKVAEEVLYKLENATIGQVSEWLLPAMATGAAAQLMVSGARADDLVDPEALKSAVVLATRSRKRDDYLEVKKAFIRYEQSIMVYEAAFDVLHSNSACSDEVAAPSLECIADLARALVLKWKTTPGGDQLIPSGVPIAGTYTSTLGNTVRQLMSIPKKHHVSLEPSQTNTTFPDVYKKYYTMRWRCVRPTQGCRAVPQRMFAVVGEDDFLVAGSFTNDVLFS